MSQFDFNTGLLTVSTDQNGNQTIFSYDFQQRPSHTTFPDNGQTTYFYPSATKSEVRSKIDDTSLSDFITYVDSFGRKSRTARVNGEALQYDIQDFCYDKNGRLSFQSYAYQSNDDTVASVCSGAGDSISYDALDRPMTLTHSDLSVSSISYTGRAMEVTDEGNGSQRVSRILQSDALGRLSKVCEVSSNTLLGNGGTPGSCGLDIPATGFLTSYSYNLLDNLTTVTQGTLVARSFAYDSLSRLMSEAHPETGGAQTTYGYDNDGLLITRTRPAPNQALATVTITTNYQHDPLHRLLSINYANDTTATPDAGFSYDLSTAWGVTLGNGNGRLSSTSTADGGSGQIMGYDPLGRLTTNEQCTFHACGSLNYLYDLVGDVTSASNGAGVTFSYAYNIAPRLTGMTSSFIDSQHPAALLSNVHYSQFGPVSDTLGNGLNESFGYSAYGKQQSYSSALYSYSLGFAPNWNVTSAIDSVNGSWTYTYDQFNRLVTSNKNSGAQTFNYVYDRYGNRMQQNAPQGGPAPQYLFDNSNHISTTGVVYDAAGNVTNDGFHTYAYDAENRLAKVDANPSLTYGYDAFSRRVQTPTYDVLYDQNGKAVALYTLTGIWAYGEIYAGGRHLATYSNGTTTFIHSDWLGSKRLVTNLTGASAQTCLALPFGDGLNCTGTESQFNHFTDDIHDSETNLENTWFRQLSVTQGRWLTSDPYVGSIDLSDPQSLNRYSYVKNDPENLLDELGLADNGAGQQTCFFGDKLFLGDAFCQLLRGLNGSSGSDSGGPSHPVQNRRAPSHVNCSTVLPNGKTVGNYVQQFRADLDSVIHASNSTEGDNSGLAATATFVAIVKGGGPIDFKNIFKGQGDPTVLGEAGNFAYYAIGSGLLPDIELNAGATIYGIYAVATGQKPLSELTGRGYSDSSADAVRNTALAANGCKQ
jgi:RHS repeat-associated protein